MSFRGFLFSVFIIADAGAFVKKEEGGGVQEKAEMSMSLLFAIKSRNINVFVAFYVYIDFSAFYGWWRVGAFFALLFGFVNIYFGARTKKFVTKKP